MIKVGTKAKVVIGIINTHFSIYPSNEAFLFILRKRFIRNTASTLSQPEWLAPLRSVYIVLVAWSRMSTNTVRVCSKQVAEDFPGYRRLHVKMEFTNLFADLPRVFCDSANIKIMQIKVRIIPLLLSDSKLRATRWTAGGTHSDASDCLWAQVKWNDEWKLYRKNMMQTF